MTPVQGASFINIPTVIDAGAVPPGYTHTFVIDLYLSQPTATNPNPSDRFLLDLFQWDADEGGTGDLLIVLNANGECIATYRSRREVEEKYIECQFAEWDQRPFQFKRLYIVLQTSSTITPRRLRIGGVILGRTVMPFDRMRAHYIQDDINYDTPECFVFAVAEDGSRLELQSPWRKPGPSWRRVLVTL